MAHQFDIHLQNLANEIFQELNIPTIPVFINTRLRRRGLGGQFCYNVSSTDCKMKFTWSGKRCIKAPVVNIEMISEIINRYQNDKKRFWHIEFSRELFDRMEYIVEAFLHEIVHYYEVNIEGTTYHTHTFYDKVQKFMNKYGNRVMEYFKEHGICPCFYEEEMKVKIR